MALCFWLALEYSVVSKVTKRITRYSLYIIKLEWILRLPILRLRFSRISDRNRGHSLHAHCPALDPLYCKRAWGFGKIFPDACPLAEGLDQPGYPGFHHICGHPPHRAILGHSFRVVRVVIKKKMPAWWTMDHGANWNSPTHDAALFLGIVCLNEKSCCKIPNESWTEGWLQFCSISPRITHL